MTRPPNLLAPLAPLVLLLLTAPVLASPGDADVSFPGQSSGGRIVRVASVDLPDGGFVAIHDATLLSAQDPFGSVVGVSGYLAPGTHRDVPVTLQRSVAAPNETLVAMPHRDTNGNHLYDFLSSRGAQDGPVAGGAHATPTFAGNIVVQPATVNLTADVRASPQDTTGRSLLVDEVEMKDGGFVAIHDSTLLSAQDPFGSVVGVSPYLPAGIHRDVLVPFTFNGPHNVTKGPFIAMPHRDTNGNRAYDFVATRGAQDGPFPGDVGTFVGAIVVAVVDGNVTRDAGVTFPPATTGGRIVQVPEVFLPEAGFVALHDSTLLSAQDPFGSVIGVSARLEEGLHRNVTVELGNVPGNPKGFTGNASDTIIAMPHRDSNGNGVYDFVTSRGAEDGPFTGGPHAASTFAGNIVIAAANVNRTAAVQYACQDSATGRSVVVRAVDLSEGGFVALHDASLLTGDALGSVIGVSGKLGPGLYRDLTVPLGTAPGTGGRALNASGTVIAMVHKDTDGDGVYGFVTSRGAQDGPVLGAAGTPQGIVLASGDTTVLRPLIAAAAGYPSTPAPQPAPGTGAAPAPAPAGAGGEGTRGTPGLGILGLVAASAAAGLALRRRP